MASSDSSQHSRREKPRAKKPRAHNPSRRAAMDVDTDTSLSPPPQHLATRRLPRKRISANALAQAQSYSPDPLLAISPALQPRFFFGPESSPSSPSMPVPAA